MALFLLSFAVVALAVLGMAVGSLCGRRPLQMGCRRLNAEEGLADTCASCAFPWKPEQCPLQATDVDATGAS